MENKDINTSKFGVGLFIGILVTLVLVMGGYLVYDKVIKNDETKDNGTQQIKEEEKEKQEEKEVAIDLNNSELSNLYKTWVEDIIYNSYMTGGTECILNKLANNTDEAKIIMALSNLKPEKISCKNAKDVVYGEYICGSPEGGFDQKYIKFEKHGDITLDKVDTSNSEVVEIIKNTDGNGYKMNNVDDKIKELFGNVSYNRVDVSSDTLITPIHYDSGLNTYIIYECTGGCGGLTVDLTIPKLVEATKKGNTINMNVEYTDPDNKKFEYNFTFEYNKTTNSYNLKSLQKIK